MQLAVSSALDQLCRRPVHTKFRRVWHIRSNHDSSGVIQRIFTGEGPFRDPSGSAFFGKLRVYFRTQ